MGQAYMKSWKRALLFLAQDGAAIATWYNNSKLADEKKREYTDYANLHWDFGTWIHDYYKWYEFKEGDDVWNSIREVFTNHSDTLSGCAENPELGNCYIDIWEHSHKVQFTYKGNIMSSNSDEFEDIFQFLCGNQNQFDKKCTAETINLFDPNGDSVFLVGSIVNCCG